MRSYRRYLLDSFLKSNIKFIRGDVLDVGGNKKNKRGSFVPPIKRVSSWRYLNIDINTDPDIIASAEKIPLNDNSINTVLFTEVIEYIKSPDDALKEIRRILRKDGCLILTSPFLHPFHADFEHDRFRITESALRELLIENQFKIIKFNKMGGPGSVIYDILRISLGYAGKNNSKVLNFVLQKSFRFFAFIDKKTKKQSKYVNTGYSFIASKI